MNQKVWRKIFNDNGLYSSLTTYPGQEEALPSFPTMEVVESRDKYLIGKDVIVTNEEGEYETDTPQENNKEKTSIVTEKNKKKLCSYFEQECKLIGVITNVDKTGETFVIQAENPSDGIIREIQFSFNEVERSEYPKIVKNGRVIFVYGKHYVNGTQFNSSKLYFRDNPVWSRRELEKRKKSMMELFEGIDDDDDIVE